MKRTSHWGLEHVADENPWELRLGTRSKGGLAGQAAVLLIWLCGRLARAPTAIGTS